MFYLKKLISALVMPPASLLLLSCIGLWLARRRPRLGIALATLGLGLLAAFSLPSVGNALLASLEVANPPTEDQLARAEAIVVLGNGRYRNAPEYGGDTVNGDGLERLRYGAHLARKTGLPIAISGGAPFGGTPEATIMRAVMETDFRVAVKWAESESLDTGENAAFTAALLKEAGVKRIVLVTHAWHMRRATMAFERQGLAVVPAPTRYANSFRTGVLTWIPQAAALRNSEIALHEWLGILVAKTRDAMAAR